MSLEAMSLEEALSVLDKILKPQSLSDIQEQVFRQSWQGKSYSEIAEDTDYTSRYIRDVGYKLWQVLSKLLDEKVTKSNLQSVLRRYSQLNFVSEDYIKGRTLSEDKSTVTTLQSLKAQKKEVCTQIHESNLSIYKPKLYNEALDIPYAEKSNRQVRKDWGEAIDTSIFYGRSKDIIKLKHWILDEHCRLVGLLGMGGIGKTALSIKLCEQIQNNFEYVIWRSLRNAPPIQEILATLLQFLSNDKETKTNTPNTIDNKILRLIYYLRQHRCLIVLDNVDSLFNTGDRVCQYRDGYEQYGELLKQIGEVNHQSCLLLTSREKPGELVPLEGNILPVRTLQLSGLQREEAEIILKAKGISGSKSENTKLIEYYKGNPLALKIISTSIKELFDGNFSTFFEQELYVFKGIYDLLSQQFERLSTLEKQIMYWLSINRELVSLPQLYEDFIYPLSKREVIEALNSLQHRSMVEKKLTSFTQQPVLMDYVTDCLIDQVFNEVATEEIDLLMNHSLVKAQTKDYIRSSQINLIIKPLIDRLNKSFGSDVTKEKLNSILSKIKSSSLGSVGYACGNIINLLIQMNINLEGYDFSSLTIAQAYFKNINLCSVNFAYSHIIDTVFTDNVSNSLSVEFSPDGEFLATGDANSTICLWQVINGKKSLTYKGHTSWIWSVAFSPDGQILASGSEDQTIKLWDVHTGQCLKTLHGHSSQIQAVTFSPDGQILASGSEEQTIKLWDVHTGQCLKTLYGHSSQIQAVTFSPDAPFVASGSADNTIKLWDVDTGQCLKTLYGHSNWIWSIAFSPDGQILASGSADNTIKLWDVDTGSCLSTLYGHSKWVRSATFSSDGLFVASGSDDNTIKLWDVHTGQCLKTLYGHSNWIWSIAFSPDGQTLASSSADQKIRLWNISTGQCLKTLHGYINWAWSITFNLNGYVLVSGNSDNTIKLWDVHTGRCLKTLYGHSNWIWSIAFSPDGQTLASGSDDNTIKLWDIHTGQCLKTLHGNSNRIWSIAFSPDGQTLASSGDDTTVKLWNVHTGQCLSILYGHSSWVRSVTFSPDGQTLASSGDDTTVKLWDVHTGQCLSILYGHSSWVWSVAFSPDGQTLASVSKDHTIKLWNVHTGQHIQTLYGHSSWVWSVAFSPDGQTLISGSADQTIKLWDVTTGLCFNTIDDHSSCVCSIAPSPDGRIFASASQDETIKFWCTKTGKLLKTLKAKRPYSGMNITGIQGLSEAQKSTLKTLGAVEI